MSEPDQPGTRLDPRIKGELDKLNSTSEEINRLEKELDDARQQFRVTLTESSQKLSEAAKRCGKAVMKAKSYHEARVKEKKAHEKVQEAAYSYQRAVGMFRAAKETITIAEDTSMQGNKKRDFDSALQEMLNHATVKLNAAEQEKVRGQKEHQQLSKAYVKSQAKVEQLAKKLRKSIAKSAAYYDLRDAFYSRLENLKESVENRQRLLATCKKRYREALRNLERISEDIHRSRQLQLEASPSLHERSSGVGAESEPEPTRSTNGVDDEVFTPETVPSGDKSGVSGEKTVPAAEGASTQPSGEASGGVQASRNHSSYSSVEDGEPQSPVLTDEHGLPTLSKPRPKMHRIASDPDFYQPKLALAKLPGILPEEKEVIEATLRGYRSFDADLTEEEVTELRQASAGSTSTGNPVILVESPDGVVVDPEIEGEDEEELEVYEPEEIEMSQLGNKGNPENVGGAHRGPEELNSVEMTTFEQETQLNGGVDSISSPEISEGENEDDVMDEELVETEDAEPNPPETSQSGNSHEVTAENGPDSPEMRQRRTRSLSFGAETKLPEEDEFLEQPDQLPSPVKNVQVSELERPGSPALFQYHAEQHKHDVHEADAKMAFTFPPSAPSDGTAANENGDEAGSKTD